MHMSMTQEAREERAAYMREWRKKNPEKQRVNQQRYWERKAAEKRREAAESGENRREKRPIYDY